MERFVCCQTDTHFEKIKRGYRCKDCGKIFLDKSICYLGVETEFKSTKTFDKFRGRKADYIKNVNKHIFSTLETGKVVVMNMDDNYSVMDSKAFKVKKNVLEHKLNNNNTFLTITDKGVVNVYNMETQKMVSEIKLGIEYSHYKIQIFPFGSEGKWLYIDTEKILLLSNDLRTLKEILLFKDYIEGEKIMSISSVDYTLGYNSFAIHIRYWKKENAGEFIKHASVIVKNNGETCTVEKNLDDSKFDLTYDFIENIYYGIYHNKMISMTQIGKINEMCELPIIKRYTNGGGILWLEEFIRFPEKLYFFSENLIAFLYLHELIVLDIEKSEIKFCFDAKSNLIQSFIIFDKNVFSFSAGLNTYIMKIA